MIISVQVDYHFACRLARFLLRCLKIAVSMTLTRDTSSFTCDGSGLGPARSQGMTGHDKGPTINLRAVCGPVGIWVAARHSNHQLMRTTSEGADWRHTVDCRATNLGGLQGAQSVYKSEPQMDLR